MKILDALNSKNPVAVLTDVLDMTPLELSFKMGVSATYISMWRTGKQEIPDKHLLTLKKLIEARLDEIEEQHPKDKIAKAIVAETEKLVNKGMFA